MRNKIIIFLLFNFYLSYSQNINTAKELNILIITNEKLISLDGINYISTTKFVKEYLKRTNPTYIIYKQSDGTYLKWKCFDEMNIE